MEAGCGFGVNQDRFSENFFAEFCEVGVVFDEFLAGVDVVVVVVVFAVVIEP